MLFAIAFAWRIAYLARLAGTPLFESLTEDASIYWAWAGVLDQRGLRERNAFFLGPLYPYALHFLRAIVGDSISAVLHTQALWGAAATVLLADAARRISRPVIGIIVGGLVCFHGQAVFFDGLILAESLLFALEALMLWIVVRIDWDRAMRAYLVLGLLIGLLAVGRATAALLMAGAVLTLVPWRAGRRTLATGLALLGGFILMVLPVTIRNHAVSGEFIPLTYSLGYNFYVGTNAEATGAFVRITGSHEIQSGSAGSVEGGAVVDGREYLEKVAGVVLAPGASSDYWLNQAFHFAREHPGTAARLFLRKLAMTWNRREYPQIENIDAFRALAGPLGLQFTILGALGFAGLWFSWRRGPAGRFLATYVVLTTLGIAMFFVTDRYRHHLVPALALLAALAVDEAWNAIRRRSVSGVSRVALAMAAAIVVLHLPVPVMSASKNSWSLAADLGGRWMEQGRPDLAITQYQMAVAIESRETPSSRNASVGGERGTMYYEYARALGAVGRSEESLAWYERAARAAPDKATFIRTLADRYERGGRTAAAESLYARLPYLVGGEGAALASRGWQAARAARYAQAESLFARATGIDPRLHDAWGALIRLQIQSRRLDEAARSLKAAERAGLPVPSLRAHEAFMSAVRGDVRGARSALAQVPEAATRTDPTLADIVSITRRLIERPPGP